MIQASEILSANKPKFGNSCLTMANYATPSLLTTAKLQDECKCLLPRNASQISVHGLKTLSACGFNARDDRLTIPLSSCCHCHTIVANIIPPLLAILCHSHPPQTGGKMSAANDRCTAPQ
jgi:hypothetical protein